MPIKKRSHLRYHISIIVILFTTILMGCYENKEGCLDLDSSNYDVTADNACDDCCSYPELSLLISQFVGEDGFNTRDTFINNIGREFIIKDLQIYISQIVVDGLTESYRTTDLLKVTIGSVEDQVIDDIVLLKPSSLRYTIGTFIQFGQFNELSLTLGVPQVIDQADIIELPTGHPLLMAGDSLYVSDSNQFVKSRLVLHQIGFHDEPDTIQLLTPACDYTVNIDIDSDRGSNLTIPISVDYLPLLSGIDYETMTPSAISQSLSDNICNVTFLSE